MDAYFEETFRIIQKLELLKVLIITYYWPPAGGSGVQRWLKFVKYLHTFGIESVVYTPKKSNYHREDRTLNSEIPKNTSILKRAVFDPADILFWKRKAKNSDFNYSVGCFWAFIRGNLFVPDPKIFWITPSFKFLNKYINSNEIDVVISTGPPHSMHLIAQKLHKKNKGLKWIADFRDPWSKLYYTDDFHQLRFAKRKNKKLENSVLENADCVIAISQTLQKEFSLKAKRVELITNGFDDEALYTLDENLDKKFTITYVGYLPKQSNPKLFFEVLGEICKENKEFKKDLQIRFAGEISDAIEYEVLINNIKKNAKFIGYVSHKKALELQKKAVVLLLLIPNVKENEGIVPGKIFEYLTSKRPILAIGPERGDLANILLETNAGKVIGYSNKIKLKSKVMSLYKQYKTGKIEINTSNINQYHRLELTKKLAKIIKSLK